MKYKIDNNIKQQEYLKAVELSRCGYTKDEIIENTLFPTWRVLEFYMIQNNLKLPYINHRKVHKSDSTFFDEINSFSVAYILGMTYADGCIYNNHRFGYCLSKQDEEIIEYIIKNICPSAKKKEITNTKGAVNRKPQVILRISNKRLVNVLKKKWGVKERKTLNSGLVFPNIEKKYLWAFILGLCDGDGNIFYKEYSDKHYKCFRITICLTDLPFMQNLHKFLISEGISTSLYERDGKTCKYYLLQTTSNPSAVKFCENLYNGAEFFLKRKYQKYQQFLNLDNTVLNTEIKESVSV